MDLGRTVSHSAENSQLLPPPRGGQRTLKRMPEHISYDKGLWPLPVAHPLPRPPQGPEITAPVTCQKKHVLAKVCWHHDVLMANSQRYPVSGDPKSQVSRPTPPHLQWGLTFVTCVRNGGMECMRQGRDGSHRTGPGPSTAHPPPQPWRSALGEPAGWRSASTLGPALDLDLGWQRGCWLRGGQHNLHSDCSALHGIVVSIWVDLGPGDLGQQASRKKSHPPSVFGCLPGSLHLTHSMVWFDAQLADSRPS